MRHQKGAKMIRTKTILTLFSITLFLFTIPKVAKSISTYTMGKGTQFGPTKIIVSSFLPKQAGNFYGPKSMVDGSLVTAWIEGVTGYGVGQWVKIQFQLPTKFDTIYLNNGYGKNRSVYKKNSRIKNVNVAIANGQSWNYTLNDTNSTQYIKLPNPVTSKWVKLTIQSVYPGTKYMDTCLSEIWVDREKYNYR